MRIVHAALLLLLSTCPVLAQAWRTPVIVIPGRPDIPIIINGVDVSWSVIDGDFGLDTPLGVTPTLIYRPFAVVAPYFGHSYGPHGQGPGYFPSTGEKPGYGRLEVVPPPDRPLPPPAQSYRRSWSSQSAPGVVTEYPSYMPSYMPPSSWQGGRRTNRTRYKGAPQNQRNEPAQINSGNEPAPIRPVNQQPPDQPPTSQPPTSQPASNQPPTNQQVPPKSGNGHK
jgi:hypothetical protein